MPISADDLVTTYLRALTTAEARLAASLFADDGTFHFDWRLPSGAAAPFDVVDVATLDARGVMKELHIVYETVDVRPAFEAEVGRPSWRRAHVEDPRNA